VLSIIDFLNVSIGDGTVKQDDIEGLDVAIQCIGEAFGVDPNDDDQRARLAINPATLQSIFDVYLKTRDKHTQSSASSAAPGVAPWGSPSEPPRQSAFDREKAERHKQQGNAYMSNKQYPEAIESYTQSIEVDPTNPVYHSNRAAAHSSLGDHASAVSDAKNAIDVDPSFVKGYHRLGHAHFSMGDFVEAAGAFKKGLNLEPHNTSLKTGYEQAQARIPASEIRTEDDEDEPTPSARPAAGSGGGLDFSHIASMLGGGGGGTGGGGGGGGMPDIGSMLNNPALMGMAQQMMANGGIERLMQNPALANLASRVQSGGGMPSMSELMSDPSLREMAQQFMGHHGPPPGST